MGSPLLVKDTVGGVRSGTLPYRVPGVSFKSLVSSHVTARIMETPRKPPTSENTSPLSSWFLTGGPPRFSPPRAEESVKGNGGGRSEGSAHLADEDTVQQFLELLASETRAWDISNAYLQRELSRNGASGANEDT